MILSSARFKENIKDMGSKSDVLLKLRPVVFNYKNRSPEHISYGLIAEEVSDIMPDMVIYDKDYQAETVKYHDLSVLLLNELQKMHKRVEKLERELKIYAYEKKS